jgi:hypothetical protein
MTQISSIHSSIEAEQPKQKKYSHESSFGDSCGEGSSNAAAKPGDNLCSHSKKQHNEGFSHLLAPLASLSLESESRAESGENEGNGEWENKKSHPSLTLELTKAYDFNPSSWNKR